MFSRFAMSARNERQESWFSGLEGAFRHFGGITEEVLLDNDRGLVAHHDRLTREVEFNARLHAFAKQGFSASGLCTVSGPYQGQG